MQSKYFIMVMPMMHALLWRKCKCYSFLFSLSVESEWKAQGNLTNKWPATKMVPFALFIYDSVPYD